MNDINDMRPHYHQLGINLHLQEPDIQVITMQNPHSMWLCLKDVIDMWLNKNTGATEEPNRRQLVEAIRKINKEPAETLEKKYKT